MQFRACGHVPDEDDDDFDDEDWDDNDGPMGYRVIDLDVLVRHFIKTNPLRNA
jgi:hypothetical protein